MGGTNGFRGCGAGVRVAGAIREGVRVAGAIRKGARVAGAIRKGVAPHFPSPEGLSARLTGARAA